MEEQRLLTRVAKLQTEIEQQLETLEDEQSNLSLEELYIEVEHLRLQSGKVVKRSERLSKQPQDSIASVKLECGFSTNQKSKNANGVNLEWKEAAAQTFHVRIGPNYKKNGKKEASLESLYTLVGVDLIRSSKRIHQVCERIELPPSSFTGEDFETKIQQSGLPKFIVCNALIPYKGVSIFNGKKDDGTDPGCSLIFYFEIKKSTLDAAVALSKQSTPKDESLVPSVALLRRFCAEWEINPDIRRRFKAIGAIDNLKDIKLTGASLVERYNGKPAIIYKAGDIFERKGEYLEVDISIHRFGFMCKKGLDTFRHRMAECVLRTGFVIQGEPDEELPERMIGCCTMNKLDLGEAIEI